MNTCEGENGSIECMRTLRGLRPGRTYEAWVKAATIVGDGPITVAVACMTSVLGMYLIIYLKTYHYLSVCCVLCLQGLNGTEV